MRKNRQPKSPNSFFRLKGWILLLFSVAVIESLSDKNSHASEDLPSHGRSAFDHLVSRMGGLPYPFDDLIDWLKGNEKVDIARTQFAHGRSLQRDFTDFDSPRDMIALKPAASSTPISSPDELINRLGIKNVYIGYSERANTLEIISYNESLGRYEFQLVTNYGPGLKPELTYPPRSLCISCHQNGGPIFASGPWSESDLLLEHRQKLENGEYYRKNPRARIQRQTPDGKFFNNVLDYDLSVRDGAHIVDTNFNDIWTRGCGKDSSLGAECRRLLMEVLFEFELHGTKILSPETNSKVIRLGRIFSDTWPDQGIVQHNSVIPNRTPSKSPHGETLPPDLDPLTERRASTLLFNGEQGFLSNQYSPEGEFWAQGLDGMDATLKSLRGIFDPEEIRYLLQASGGDEKKLFAALRDPRMDGIFKPTPLNRHTLYLDLLKSLSVRVPSVSRWEAEEKRMPKPEPDIHPQLKDGLSPRLSEIPNHHTTASDLTDLKKYCGGCHSKGTELPFHFMAGSDEQILKNLSDPLVRERISLRLQSQSDSFMMPPPKSPQGKEFRKEARNRSNLLEKLESIWSSIDCAASFRNHLPRDP